MTFVLHSLKRGFNHLLDCFTKHLIGHDRCGRIGSHTTGVWAGITVVCCLVVLRCCERQEVLSIGDNNEAGFFSLQKLLDHHPGSSARQKVSTQHIGDCRFRFLYRLRNDHTLPRCQAISLDDNGRYLCVQIFISRFYFIECPVISRRNIVFLQEGFGENLGPFQLRSSF